MESTDVARRSTTAESKPDRRPVGYIKSLGHMVLVSPRRDECDNDERDDGAKAHDTIVDRATVLGFKPPEASVSSIDRPERVERQRGNRGVTVSVLDHTQAPALALIRSVLVHPHVWAGFANDFMGDPEDFIPPWLGARVYFMAKKDKDVIGIGMCAQFQTGIYVGHWGFYPWAKARDVLYAGREGLRMMFDRPDCWMVLGFTPASNRAALYASRRLGFKRVGVLPDATRINGDWTDLVMSVCVP